MIPVNVQCAYSQARSDMRRAAFYGRRWLMRRMLAAVLILAGVGFVVWLLVSYEGAVVLDRFLRSVGV